MLVKILIVICFIDMLHQVFSFSAYISFVSNMFIKPLSEEEVYF